MTKRGIFNLLGLILIVFSVIFFYQTRVVQVADAVQGWAPGNCGWTLSVVQWSCNTNTDRCYEWESGETPRWYCDATSVGYTTEALCNDSCTGNCEYTCLNGWARHCVISDTDVGCDHPNENTCTADVYAVQCSSLAGGDDCSTSTEPIDVRQCWVGNGPPPPDDPPPGGGGCDGNWWGCGAGSCLEPFDNQSACETSTGGSCQCGSCPAACTSSTGRRAIFLFEDTNENGAWDHAAGELRISTTSSCVASNAQYVAGAQILVDGEARFESCNVGNSEFTGAVCTWDDPVPPATQCNDGDDNGFTVGPCERWGPENNGVNSTCFTQHSCGGGCHYSGDGCNGAVPEAGVICDSGNCSGSGDLKSGSYLIMPRDTGNHTVGATVPAGWRISNGMSGNPITVNWSRTNGSCEGGPVGIGLVRDTNTSCYVSPSSTTVAGGTGSVSVRLWGSTDATTTHTARLWLQTKNPNTTAPTALQMNPIPALTTQFLNSGRYSYQYTGAACTTSNGTSCTTLTDVTGLPQGSYYFHCDVVQGTSAPFAPECSGNPSCLYEGLGGLVDCAANGWQSCLPSSATPTDNAPLTATCVPSCTPACGGPDGCGGTCASTDLGMPSSVQNLAPTGNYTVTSTTVPITWTPPATNAALVDSYEIKVFAGILPINENAITNRPCNNTPGGAVCASVSNTITSWNYAPQVAKSRNINIAVRPRNLSCSNQSAPWVVTNVTLQGEITGNFYIDNGNAAIVGGFCRNGGTQPASVQTGTNIVTTMNSNPVGSSSIGASTYTISAVPYTPTSAWGPLGIMTLTLDNPDAENTLACACPVPGSDPFVCQYGGVAAPRLGPNAPVNWYLDLYDLSNDPWWQTRGGLAYARTGVLSTDIPRPCVDENNPAVCVPYMITREVSNGLAVSAGVPMTGGGAILSGTDAPGYFTDRNPQPRAQGTDHSGIVQEDYAFFSSLYNLSQVAQVASSNLVNKDSLPAPVNPDADGTEVYYRNGDLTITPTEIWAIAPGEKKVLFVNGDLTFQGPGHTSNRMIRVDTQIGGGSGFIAFIASGDITFDENVGHPNYAQETPSNIDGLFVADGQIIIEGAADANVSDRKFLGAGTFVGWSGFDMQRDFANDADPLSRALNNLDPTESFEFLPGLTRHIPDKMKTPVIEWQEVN